VAAPPKLMVVAKVLRRLKFNVPAMIAVLIVGEVARA
jgi:hypothetical protein